MCTEWGNRGMCVLCPNLCTKWGGGGSTPLPTLATYPQERALVPIVEVAEWAPGPVWKVLQPWFKPQTFQPIAGQYTDYALLVPVKVCTMVNVI